MSFSTEVRKEVIGLKMWDNKVNINQDEKIARLCIREAFIRSGFINDPNKEYHLEMLFKTSKKADEIKELLENFGINAKTILKGKDIMLYIKEGEEISNFLALIGANKAVLKFEEIRVLRDTRNNINRIVNCETANLNKTINAAVSQIEDIKLLKQKNKFKDLSKELKEIAILRLKHQDASYEQLGELLDNKIGKSGVNHRLKKLSELAKELRGK